MDQGTQRVFVLHHSHELEDGADEVKVIGVYSSEDRALAAASTLKGIPGFMEFPQGFEVSPYEIDRTFWGEGFARADQE